jgi:hypothetical protein
MNANSLFFDFPDFLQRLNKCSTLDLQNASGVSLVKLLLVVALERLFLGRGASSSGLPGIREFLRGADLPSTLVLPQDPVITLETLCMLAIYAQAADMHEVACLHVSILYL